MEASHRNPVQEMVRTCYAYGCDAPGRLSSVTKDGTLVNRYLYGALNRLEKAVNGEGVEALY